MASIGYIQVRGIFRHRQPHRMQASVERVCRGPGTDRGCGPRGQGQGHVQGEIWGGGHLPMTLSLRQASECSPDAQTLIAQVVASLSAQRLMFLKSSGGRTHWDSRNTKHGDFPELRCASGMRNPVRGELSIAWPALPFARSLTGPPSLTPSESGH